MHILGVAKEDQEHEELELKRKKKISPKKLHEFISDVVIEFYKDAGMRSVFNYLGLYKDSVHTTSSSDKIRFGISQASDKAAFFEDWHVSYSGWGENYGRVLAAGENASIIGELKRLCLPIQDDNIDFILSKFDRLDEAIIIASNTVAFGYDRRDKKRIDNPFYSGSYIFNSFSIPVFRVFAQGNEELILVLNRNKCAQLAQESPINDGEDSNKITDVFYINIASFSEDIRLMEDFVKMQIDWVKRKGDEQKQREHLQELVLIQIYERFVYPGRYI